MVKIHSIDISPPLLNSSCAWASDLKQLTELYESAHTGAVTTRTAKLNGFQEGPQHTVVFAAESVSSLNSYGYSPYPLRQYIEWTYALLTSSTQSPKPVILSITDSSPPLVAEMLLQIHDLRRRLKSHFLGQSSSIDPSSLVAVELNTSCPNIPDLPPPSYDPETLAPFLSVLAASFKSDPTLTIGLKLPPYVYAAQFKALVEAVAQHSFDLDGHRINPIAYLACTNTLGSSFMFSDQIVHSDQPQDALTAALPTGFGGLAGEAIHPISLGNVRSFAQLIGDHPDPSIHEMKIFGIGGLTNASAKARMHEAGAHVVGCATLLGRHGVKAFEMLASV
ncbi:dihydroorotate dehydrogenase [Steccherinum ochraceum]|uniref:Dihydroorotate dehydrogenase n=1 Tax=Steccherinum ochraceum TaxID=92696 RepID=A0A4R0RVK3_9APHY|nr:dihydroorotate dehydrogenase [Steccherinum ochraceum]